MTVRNQLPLEVSLAELRRLRTLHSKSGLHPHIRALLPKVLDEVVASKLLQPAIAWDSRRLLETSGTRVRLEGGLVFEQAEAIVEMLSEASELVMAVGSIGPNLEQRAREWASNGRQVEAFILGEIGNLAIGKLSDYIPHSIREWALGRGFEISGALSPGGKDFDLAEQRLVVEIASARRIGVELTTACMLLPIKSVSMVIGLGHGLPTWDRSQACDLCSSRDHCRLRSLDSEPAPA
jgi:hypothetical protein